MCKFLANSKALKTFCVLLVMLLCPPGLRIHPDLDTVEGVKNAMISAPLTQPQPGRQLASPDKQLFVACSVSPLHP